jgi:uncharacterized membrane protein (GlpM family)
MSTVYITIVVAFSVFTDLFIYAGVVPVTPFALQEHYHVAPDKLQFWTSILIALSGIVGFVSSSR